MRARFRARRAWLEQAASPRGRLARATRSRALPARRSLESSAAAREPCAIPSLSGSFEATWRTRRSRRSGVPEALGGELSLTGKKRGELRSKTHPGDPASGDGGGPPPTPGRRRRAIAAYAVAVFIVGVARIARSELANCKQPDARLYVGPTPAQNWVPVDSIRPQSGDGASSWKPGVREKTWRRVDSNHGPRDYEGFGKARKHGKI
jgi:hypothetical protein